MSNELNIPGLRGTLKYDYSLAHLTWFKVGGPADILFKPKDVEDLALFLKHNNTHDQLSVSVFGAGSNVIIRDYGIDGVVVKLGRAFTEIGFDAEGNLDVMAGCLNFNLAKFAAEHSIKGLEFLIGIPGTIGGGIAMNAGAYGREYKDITLELEALDRAGKLHKFNIDEIGFSYRKNSLPEGLIFTKVKMRVEKGDKAEIIAAMNEISTKREATQPVKEKTGGSTFANPPGDKKAWQLIDEAGCRGRKVGGAMMSEKHCNFMINLGDATASDMEELGEQVRFEVKHKTGIELKWEIKRIGRRRDREV